ncbi:DUF6090 family protein [Flagellimonas oceanensis]|uniref:DUF6090 family protein n=1 Tax=Flagellimonas oceanensis TaxID=2499163 RepID=UPI0013E03513|nr:DUF6090 family protein [Allomuricauda oceanensis]
MLNENRFSKYLLYAIGEIVLVVIGILIALQANNWNEKRKETLLEFNLVDKMIDQSIADSILFTGRLNSVKSDAILFGHYISIGQGTANSLESTNYPGNLLPYIKMNDGSNLIRNHAEDFKLINDLELREKLMEYSFQTTRMNAAIELLNVNLQEYLIPLQLEYYDALKPFDSSSSLEEMKHIFQNSKMESRFVLFRKLNFVVLKHIEEVKIKNHEVIEALKSYKYKLNP